MPDTELTRSYVAYLDIIGYTTLVEEAVRRETVQQTVQRLLDATEGAKQACEGWIADRSMEVFSDCVLLALPESTGTALGILQYAAHVTGRLAYHDFWVKGAIVHGLHIHRDSVLFSPALVAAHGMEQTEAFHPRVLVDDEVVKRCRESVSDGGDEELLNGIWCDNDGRSFLNYLGLTAGRDPQHSESRTLMMTHQRNLQNQLCTPGLKPRYAAKYAWLASYHDRFCLEGLPHGEGTEYLIQWGGIKAAGT
ncbi:MAG: hypothetical protein WCP21_09875 [Armatimonadota bacterium]